MTDALSMDLSMDPAVMEAEARAATDAASAGALITGGYLSSSIGCSELAPMMVAFDLRDGMPDHIQRWIGEARTRALHGARRPAPRVSVATWCAERAYQCRTPLGPMPTCLAEKAGLTRKPPRKPHMQAGELLEPALWRTWKASLGARSAVVVDTLRSQFDVLGLYPAEWGVRPPRVARDDEPALVDYPDGWGETILGERLVVNCKTSREWKEDPDPPAWIQMQAEAWVTRSDFALLVLGQKWLADYMREPVEQRPVRVWQIEPDESVQSALVEVARESIRLVEDVRKRWYELKGASR